MSLLLVLALLVQADPQENEIRRLQERLEQDDPSVRQEAERRLLQIGEPARPALEKLAQSGTAELRERARAILAALEREAVRGRFLGPAWTVTLKEGEYVLGDLPALLKDQIPVDLKIPEEAAPSKIRIGAEGMGVWRFLDHLCEAQGGLRIPLDQPERGLGLALGKPPRSPVSYSGPFRITIDKLTLESRHPYETETKYASMVLAIAWQPNVHPLGAFFLGKRHEFQLTDLDGADGKSLLDTDGTGRRWESMTLDKSRDSGVRDLVAFLCPAPEVRRLRRVQGGIRLVLPARKEVLEIRSSALSGKSVTSGPYRIEVAAFTRESTGIRCMLRFALLGKGSEETARQGQVELRARVEDETIAVTGKDGREHPFKVTSSSHTSGAGDETLELSGTFDLEGEPESLRIPFVSDYFEQDVRFEFRDVDLP